ncbi:MAG: hypothetical protein FJW31_00570 [Acidobacteria bacterium]|nr:hypothetical protein [Acidobacteriota bacterium]
MTNHLSGSNGLPSLCGRPLKLPRLPGAHNEWIRLSLPLLLLIHVPALHAEQIQLDGWTANVDRSTLSIRMRAGADDILVAAGTANLNTLGLNAQLTPRAAAFTYASNPRKSRPSSGRAPDSTRG